MRRDETKEPTFRQKITRGYTYIVVVCGAFIFFTSLGRLPVSQVDLSFLVLIALTTSSLSIMSARYPRFRLGLAASDIFIFLMILVFDSDAAIVIGATGALISAIRRSKEPLALAFKAGSMACATFATVLVVRSWLVPVTSASTGTNVVALVSIIAAMASVHYLVNIGLNGIEWALEKNLDGRSGEALYTLIANFVSAAVAGVIASYIGLFGFYAFMTATPVIVVVGIICYSYLSYHQNIKASLSQTERAERYLTELQESEERYRHSFERFRSAFNHAPIGMALVAPFGGWLQVNRSLSEILGYSEEQLLGMSYQSMIHPKDCYNFLYNA
ncbi:MAG TPA: PAS domain S-box protein, partial [Blastocatellia bacterium]|nr:PAS domain S-box protein [Blastocatellia bacterium]